MSSSEKLLALFENGELANVTVNEICKTLQIPYREKGRVLSLLDELCKDGRRALC